MINIIQNTIGALGRTLGIIRKNLQLWLDFEKSDWVGGELVVKDKSPNTNNAKLFTGKALSFDGVNDYVDLGVFSSHNKVTIAINIKTNANTWQTGGLLSRGTSSAPTSNWSLWTSSTTLTMYIGDGVTYEGISINKGNFNANSWDRLVCVLDFENKTYKAYINNNIVIDDVFTLDIDNGSDAILLGALTSTTFFSSFDASSLELYNKAWTEPDVAFDYNNPNHLAIDNPDTDLVVTDLKGYWALSEGDGSVAYDSSGEGNNGTITGATYTPAQDTIPQLGMMDWAKGSNLIEYSEDFGATDWVKVGATISASTITSPIGSGSVDYFIPTTTTGSHYMTIMLASSLLNDKVLSINVKVDSSIDKFTIYPGGSATFANFNLTTLLATIEGNGVSANIISLGDNWYRLEAIYDSVISSDRFRVYASSGTIGASSTTENGADGINIYGAQLEQSSSAGNYILTDGAAAIDVTTIQNPTNKGYDILGNALRLREHAFNLDGSGYAEVADDATLNISNGTLQFWLKTSDTKFNILSGQSTSEFIGTTDNSVWSFGNAGTITSYIGAATANTQPLYDGNWSFYTFTGVDLSTWTAIEISNLAGFELDGLLDEVMIYSSVLTIKEIKNNYNIGINKHKATSSFSDDFSSDYGI